MLTPAAPAAPQAQPDHGFTRATVVGAGLMGRGIAAVLAAGGLEVILHDANDAILDDAVTTARQRATGYGAPVAMGLIAADADLASAVSGADLVIEAVPEDLVLKQDILARIGDAAPQAVLATNTSVLPVTAVTAAVRDPGRALGTHWWNPPDLIPVVEVVPGAKTENIYPERVVVLLQSLGKTPVVVRKDVPGFIGNRLQHALWREAVALVADGICDAETADLVARNTIGLRLARMGPLENADYVGLDLTVAIHDAVLPSLSTDAAASELLRQLVRDGDLGAKTGQGLMSWPMGSREVAARELASHVSGQVPSRSARCCEPRSDKR
jgi:3-hydroxybutyryl-CoA dehydrogenase